MHTLCIRYTLNPDRMVDFRAYVDAEQPVLVRAGGAIVGYFMPTDFAGPTHVAYGLIDFESLADYERYRANVAADPMHAANAASLQASGAVLAVERSIIARAPILA